MMPVIKTLTIRVEATRSQDFQSAKVGGEVTIELLPGEDAREQYIRARRWLAKEVRSGAKEELTNIIYGLD